MARSVRGIGAGPSDGSGAGVAPTGLGLGRSTAIDRERDDNRRSCGRDRGPRRFGWGICQDIAHASHRTEGVSQSGQTGTMELIEIEDEHRVTREEAAKWLHRLADSLERHNEVEFVREGLRMRVEVPGEVTMEVELEMGDESSLEIELSW